MYNEKLLIMDRGTVRNIQSFVPKNKFEKLVHLVGFIIRIYHNARSPERQTSLLSFCNKRIFSNDIYTQPVVTFWKRCLCWGTDENRCTLSYSAVSEGTVTFTPEIYFFT